jgi:hypothetical protein
MAKISSMENPEFRKSVAHADGEGGLIIQTAQDVSCIIEANKKEFNSYDERARWSDNPYGNKVASIPFTAIDDLNSMGIMRGFTVVDHARFAMWLNNPDNRAWRTRPGVI